MFNTPFIFVFMEIILEAAISFPFRSMAPVFKIESGIRDPYPGTSKHLSFVEIFYSTEKSDINCLKGPSDVPILENSILLQIAMLLIARYVDFTR